MDKLIKHAVNNDSTSFIEAVKIKLESMLADTREKYKSECINKYNEEGENILTNYGIDDLTPGMHYIASSPTSFVAVTDDIATDIEKRLTDNTVNYVRTGLNFIITAM